MLGANCLAALFLDSHTLLDAHRAALDYVAAAGFPLTEISHPELLPVKDAARVRRHAQAAGVRVRAVHAPPMRRDPTLAGQRDAALLAAELGATILVVHVSSLRFASPDPAIRASARDRDLQRLHTLATLCHPLGITLGLENGRRPHHPDYLLSLLDALDGAAPAPSHKEEAPSGNQTAIPPSFITPSPPAGLVFDAGHAALRGGDPLQAAERMLPRLLHTHLHDNHGARDEHLVPGDGLIDWPALLGCLSSGGYTGALMLELHPRRAGNVVRWQHDLARGQKSLSNASRQPKGG
jgi:sugar phosphate isomerase/epimerase